MARKSEPRWRSDKYRHGWYAKVRGKLHKLADKKGQIKEAWDKLSLLLDPSKEAEKNKHLTIEDLLDQYEAAKQRTINAKGLKHTRHVVERFGMFVKGKPVSALLPGDVDKWVQDHPNWSNNTIICMTSRVRTVINFAVKKRLIGTNPIKGYESATPESRGKEALITEDEYQALLGAANARLREVLQFLRHTGCRPGEVASIEACHVHLDKRVIDLPFHKTAHKGKERLIPLNFTALELVKGLMQKWPSGKIFRNSERRAWNMDVMRSEFSKLRKRLGLRKGLTLYCFRHSMATQLLSNGVSPYLVSKALGTGLDMIEMHYGHVSANHDTILTAFERAMPCEAEVDE